jgi:hypothetical protein
VATKDRHLARARQIVAEGLPIGPRMNPCVCGAGRHAHAGANATGACKTTGCKRYRANLAYELAYKALDAQAMTLGQSIRAASKIERAAHYKSNPRKPGEWSIGASDAGTCPRAIWYRNLPPGDLVRAWSDTREAEAGTMLHNEITRRMRMIYPWRMFAHRVLIPGLDRESEIDSYDPITGEVEDYKSAGEWKWDHIGEDGPDEDTWEQVLLYGLAMEDAGHPVATIRLSYYRRANGHDETFVREYDRAAAEKARDRLLGYASALDMLVEAPDDETLREALMPRTGDGPARDPLCKRCPFRLHCWNIPAAEAAGRSGYSYTVLGPDPDDEPIIWTIQTLVEARADKRSASEREAEAKDLLDGVEPRRYGPYEGYEKLGANRDDTKSYIASLQRVFDLPDGMRPALDSIELPKKRDRSSVIWGKVRKATLEREARETKAAAKPTEGEVA